MLRCINIDGHEEWVVLGLGVAAALKAVCSSESRKGLARSLHVSPSSADPPGAKPWQ
jgi:hypothetical protein